MARIIGRLSALAVSREKRPGMHADGGGLWLQVTKSGARSWVFRFTLRGRARAMGLGPLHTIGLSDARSLAGQCRRLLLDGIDPIEARRTDRTKAALEAAKAITFKTAAEAYIASHRAGWRNEKHATQWTATLGTYAYPVFGDLPVSEVDVTLVMKAVEPLWSTKTETASRLRGRIESILDWATTRGYRQGENPARWRGHLENLLPRKAKVQKVEHFAALPFLEIGAFMAALSEQPGVSARALEFLILTAARTNETLGAPWREIDLAGKVWTIPPERMKSGREHRVPLSAPALEILKVQAGGETPDPDSYVFPGQKVDKPLSNMALLMLLKRMERGDLTAHGFRSTFRDRVSERTSYPREAAEMALAHTVPDAVEAAYRRGDLFEKRRRMMSDWAKFCSTVPSGGNVVSITAKATTNG